MAIRTSRKWAPASCWCEECRGGWAERTYAGTVVIPGHHAVEVILGEPEGVRQVIQPWGGHR